MTAPSAIQLLAEVRDLGGHLRPKPGGKLGVVLPEAEQPRLLPLLAQRKAALLVLLAYPATGCPGCNGDRFWRDGVGQWHCLRCEPETPADPFGPLPAGEADALAELELRAKLREPALARLLVRTPVVSGRIRECQICAAATVWAAGGPEPVARCRAQAWDGIPEAMLQGRRIEFTAPADSPAIGEWVRTPHGTASEVLAYDADSGAALVRDLAAPRWQWLPAAELVSELDWPVEAKR